MGHRLISSIADVSKIKSISLDIFDTVLLRDTWPEEIQFIEVAEKWVPLFCEYGFTVTSYELLTYRNYARKVLLASFSDGVDKEVTIEGWFREIIRLLSSKYDIELSENKKAHLLEGMIDVELGIESEHLTANTALIDTLLSLRDEYGFKLVFISDMYLRSTDINWLLDRAGLGKLFDEGISSADAGFGKYSGRLYRYVHDTNMIDLSKNLHIGDNSHSDYRSAVAEGSMAIHYKTSYHLRRRVYTHLYKKVLNRYHMRNRKLLRRDIVRENKCLTDHERIARAFSGALVHYVSTFSDRAHHQPDSHFVGVSSEATVFSQAGNILYSKDKPENITMLPGLSRKAIMRAVIGEAAATYSECPVAIAGLSTYGEGVHNSSEIAKFLRQIPPELLLQHMTNDEKSTYLQSIIGHQNQEYSRKIENDIRIDKYRRIIILDVGWGGTIQSFVRELVALKNSGTDVSGLYMGVLPGINRFHVDRGNMEGLLMDDVFSSKHRRYYVPEIWEYVLSDKLEYSRSVGHRQIHSALLDATAHWKSSVHAAPDAYWEIVRPEIERILVRPTQNEVTILGSIAFTVGFNKKKNVDLVDMDKSKIRYFISSIVHPKKVAKDISGQYKWTRGFIRYYKIYHVAVILKIGGIIKRHNFL